MAAINLHHHVVRSSTVEERTTWFLMGWADEVSRDDWRGVQAVVGLVRASVGFAAKPAPVTSPPGANTKLDKAKMVSVGLTLAHGDMSGYEACPWRGDCHGVCVLLNGKGGLTSTQRAWVWRTLLLAEHPREFFLALGREMGRYYRKHGEFLFRPNVNSDLVWEHILPLLGGMDEFSCYGYSKNALYLTDRAPRLPRFTVAYSVNERSNLARVRRALVAGRPIALVTDRKPGSAISPDVVRRFLGVGPEVRVIDADATDEWMLDTDGVPTVGDLSAKGKARRLIGVSEFVAAIYGEKRSIFVSAA